MKGFKFNSCSSTFFCVVALLGLGIMKEGESSGFGTQGITFTINGAPHKVIPRNRMPVGSSNRKLAKQEAPASRRFGKASNFPAGNINVRMDVDEVPHNGIEDVRGPAMNPYPNRRSTRNLHKRSADSGDSSVGGYQQYDKLDSTPFEGQKYRDTPVTSYRSSPRFPAAFCEIEVDSGIICPGLRRELHIDQFYYDVDNNRCSHFLYNGCGGNANRFSSLWECTQSCVKQSFDRK